MAYECCGLESVVYLAVELDWIQTPFLFSYEG